MTLRQVFRRLDEAVVFLLVFLACIHPSAAMPAGAKTASLSISGEISRHPFRRLRGSSSEATGIRFFFAGETNVVEFSASWRHLRVPTDSYK